VFAVVGGLLFAASLAYFLIRYHAFGAASGRWTGQGWTVITIDAALFTIFALHHSVFARTGIKAQISARVSAPLERATYVWISSILFICILWAWQDVPGTVWNITGPGQWLFHAGTLAGLVLTALAAAALDPLELAGVRQAFGWASKTDRSLRTTGAYAIVRHPIYLGWILLVWSVPVMTGTRLVFAAVSTLYLIVAVPLEERAMRRALGQRYDDYARKIRWRMLPGIY
jgi:hypothetical protein